MKCIIVSTKKTSVPVFGDIPEVMVDYPLDGVNYFGVKDVSKEYAAEPNEFSFAVRCSQEGIDNINIDPKYKTIAIEDAD